MSFRSATFQGKVTAATEHSRVAEMSANVVLINIDWKEKEMHNTLIRNMKLLATMIAGVVRNMNPTMICMCEVGESNDPLSQEQMQQVADKVIRVWNGAATGHIQLRSMFTEGAPYLTVYIDGPIRCSDHRILHNLYDAQGEPRTAQAFVCSSPCCEGIDVVNVHAPSGHLILKDWQRQQLLTNVLQSSSQATPGASIGDAHFMIGGDMNTKKTDVSVVEDVWRKGFVAHASGTS